MNARARACANLALVKYWGKRDPGRNLPERSSLSLTLGALTTTTALRFDPTLAEDRLVVDDARQAGAALARATRVLDAVRARTGVDWRADVRSENDFPTASGLASSASGLAALTVAAAAAAGWEASPEERSAVARLGSGSAARSIHGGFVLWEAGTRADGADSHGRLLHPPAHWDLRVLVAMVGEGPKDLSSTEGMTRTAASSPYYGAWLDQCTADLAEAQAALAARDLPRLGAVSERSTLAMHAAALTAEPGIFYWKPATVALLHLVGRLRDEEGRAAWFSVDAGPHVKVLTTPEDAAPLRDALAALPGVVRVVESPVGGPARVLEEDV